ncbi:hypothetical protein [Aminobacter sp. MDW-2]|uniref:hypothetical protein n=1 Tax=Aminobacter sp. MDW-2 TaxID=2666139 RepID=UPI0012AFDDE9|nr:hypothetical protein [Aminobacter sp. MDW-2]MRX31874.1 hypothetical protein [Aminobacter sp. MDW-2]QNH32350.1 hypothetical protein H5P29_17505 [Aminobacter sp. MDW-2]
MAGTKHTPAPWRRGQEGNTRIYGPDWASEHSGLIATVHRAVDIPLITAAPSMADAIKGLIGLCQLLRNRDDCPSEIRQALTYNHRIVAGYEALSAAGIDGFQPSDFDRSKAEGSSHA